MEKCDTCTRDFKTIQGLRGHQRMGCLGKAPVQNRPEDRPITQADLESLYRQLEQVTQENACLKQTHAALAPHLNPEPTAPGDYHCMDCSGANNIGGFFLTGARTHYHQTGHRLKRKSSGIYP